jgi:hypothetical protein
MRVLFASLLVFCDVADPLSLWNEFKDSLSEDSLHQRRVRLNDHALAAEEDDHHDALRSLQESLNLHLKSLADFGLPSPPAAHAVQQAFFAEHLRFDRAELAARVQRVVPMLNDQQLDIYNQVRTAVDGALPAAAADPTTVAAAPVAFNRTFFVDGIGGAGKTMVYNLLLDHVRSQGHIALAVASSGIAALLLDGGCTGHSRFQIPVNIMADSTCNIPVQSDRAQIIRAAAMILWDEAPMMHRHVYEALDRCIRDIMGVPDVPFGGKPVVFGGDFRQVCASLSAKI